MTIVKYFLLSSIICLFLSCKQDNASIDLLREAQAVIESEPEKALSLLDSIHTPENMDKDSYMQYIVKRVQAKYELHQDVTGDTLIFEAQKYFDTKNNPEKSALANYYAGCVNREMKKYDKSLSYFLKSSEYANKKRNNKLSGKIYEYIGALYLRQGLMDSAVINYKKAINYFNIERDSISTLRATNQVGRSYEDIGNLDSAYLYFSNALQIAENLNNKKHISNITQNLGATSFGMGEYDRAIAYFRSALSMEATNERQVRKINQLLLKTFNKTNDLSSAKEYALKVETSLPDVTDIHTIKIMYSTLSEYYKLTGNYKQALKYKELEIETAKQIAKEEQPLEMIKADTSFRIEQKDKVYGELLYNFYLYLSISVVILIIILIFVIFTFKQRKKDQETFRLEKEKFNKIKESLEASNRNYPRIEAEIKAMLEDN